ncbi:MAG: MBL fold metallo-hydrolase [Verrucomicrobiaceae bacterium]|nr:MBL fold metallo-hydrolase [Verrucomicrobiaceae bacterium]NCF94000.1 MBL fold metallo-hydrolase [Verrucomicrobiaceae bacterium]
MLEIEYFTGGIAATNGYACKTEETSFLVDAPEGVADWLESTGFTPNALLLTHAHFDHVLDAAQVQERWSIPTYAFAQPTPELTLEAMLGSFGPMAIQPYMVDHLVEEGLPMSFGGLTFEILHVPGHSPDSVVFLPERSPTAFGGDVLMQGGIGRSDLPGGDGKLLLKGIREKLYELDDEIAVLSGHGQPTTIGAEKRMNPFVRGSRP